ncbi:DUF7373 family lipoprotein [Mycolicibacterium llatzerense]|uniref:DUF7373 family lipoprotein n=1 Tax=Mycolicibacterium llatzerense TaxID=280871 RepID=UPI0031E452C0
MKRSLVTVYGAAAALLVAACSSTSGTPTAAPAPHLDVGQFPVTKRTIEAPATPRAARPLEIQRMFTTMPIVTDIAPTMKYVAGIHNAVATTLADDFGSGVAHAVSAAQFGISIDYRDKLHTDGAQEFLVVLIRMPSANAADAAVADPQVMGTDDQMFGAAPKPKSALIIPGQPTARAFTTTGRDSTSTVALMAHDRFVFGVWTSLPDSASSVGEYLTEQLKGLDGFAATPDDNLTALPPDSDDGVRALTLPFKSKDESTIFTDGWATVRGYPSQTREPAQERTDLTDAGVDVIGLGASTTYRARDAAGASLLADRLITARSLEIPGGSTWTVTDIPNSKCYTARDTPTHGVAHCVVPVGRYLAEYSSPQPANTKQGIAAAYLILRTVGG